MFTRKEKEKFVEELSETFSNSSLILFSDYRGLSVDEITELRDQLYERYEENAAYTISKNTLVRLALTKAGYSEEEWKNEIKGTTAILTVREDGPIEAIKIVSDFARKNKLPVLRGCYLEGVYNPPEKISELAKLPSKEELIAMVVGGIASPIRGFVYSLNGILTKLLYAINAIKEKQEEQK
ncbi:MAG: 50S ribosomal protein L10 [Kosmotogaceae bacterium]